VGDEHFGKPIEILLVEDNPGDVRLTRDGLTESKVRKTVRWLKMVWKPWHSCVVKVRMPMHPDLT